MEKKIINLADKVIKLLRIRPHLRDNDRRLICNIWWDSVPNPQSITFKDFTSLYVKGKIPESDSITRCRRKVQEEIKELRGEAWERRHRLDELVKEEIKELGATI
jgi:hypothetical protein